MNKEKFKCKKCRIPIGEHNQYLHDGMCNECFFEVYFPEEAQVFETDIKKIRRLYEMNKNENMKFRNFLKSGEFDQKSFDVIVREIKEKIDCTKCGNCCKVLKPILNKDDIVRISKHLDMATDDFIEKYVIKNNEGDFEFKHKPCMFLADNKCEIYDVRPKECKDYPHLDKDITVRCIQFFSNAEICPIAFNVLENSKEEFLEDMFAFENPGWFEI